MSGRARLLAAAAAFVLVAGGIVLLVTQTGPPTSAAPADCISAWNESHTEFGRHLAGEHDYFEAEVARIEEVDARVPLPEGDCIVVFPRSSVDPEPDAGAQVLRAGRWTALSSSSPPADVGLLQRAAMGRANADLTHLGTLQAR